jgi:hypothetical protein
MVSENTRSNDISDSRDGTENGIDSDHGVCMETNAKPLVQKENIALEKYETKYKFGELPEHVLVEIFNYLNPYQTYDSQIRIRVLSTDHNIWVNTKQNEKRKIKKEDIQQKNNLALVCKNWRIAANNDLLWKSQAILLHKQLCTKIKRSENGLFINRETRKCALDSTYKNYRPRTVNRSCISLKYLDINCIPEKNFKDHYFKLIAAREKCVQKLVKKEARDTFISNILMRIQWLFEMPYHIFLLTIIYWLCFIQVILVIIYYFLQDRFASEYISAGFLSPLLILAAIFSLGIPSFIYTHVLLKEHKLPFSPNCALFGFGIFLLSTFLSSPMVMIFLNMSILPRNLKKPFHTETIPWPVVFFPWILIFLILGVVLTFMIILSLLKDYRAGFENNFYTFLFNSYSARQFWWSLLGSSSLICFGIFFIFLGFSLEFWNYFFIPLAFLPLFLIEIIAQPFIARKEYSNMRTNVSLRSKLIGLNIIIFPTVMIISEIPCCFAQLIGPLCFLGPLLFLTQIYIFFLLIATEHRGNGSCCTDFCGEKELRYKPKELISW